MSAETESVENEVQEAVPETEAPFEAVENQEVPPEPVEQQVPLSALQKERKKRQEAEQRAKLYEDIQAQQLRERQQANPTPEPEDQYEAVTKADLGKSQRELMRQVDERSWLRENPEKAAEVNEKLTEFLKQRPNLVPAIEAAQNRYEEAWMLMNALTPKQKAALKPAPTAKKDSPGSPAAVSKAAGMNQSIDCMSMTDSEFNAWRQQQRKRR